MSSMSSAIIKSGNRQLMILEYYDSLIREVDVFTEQELLNYDEKEIITEYNISSFNTEDDMNSFDERNSIFLFDSSQSSIHAYEQKIAVENDPYREFKLSEEIDGPTPISINAHTFLNNVRTKILDKLEKSQHETFQNFMEAKKSSDKVVTSQVFKNSAFLLNCKNCSSKFKLYLFVVDFYLKEHECKLLDSWFRDSQLIDNDFQTDIKKVSLI